LKISIPFSVDRKRTDRVIVAAPFNARDHAHCELPEARTYRVAGNDRESSGTS
jgi:hypothetical protein